MSNAAESAQAADGGDGVEDEDEDDHYSPRSDPFDLEPLSYYALNQTQQVLEPNVYNDPNNFNQIPPELVCTTCHGQRYWTAYPETNPNTVQGLSPEGTEWEFISRVTGLDPAWMVFCELCYKLIVEIHALRFAESPRQAYQRLVVIEVEIQPYYYASYLYSGGQPPAEHWEMLDDLRLEVLGEVEEKLRERGEWEYRHYPPTPDSNDEL
ncbi:hypothetical protein QBC43DRAFT_116961 [Cladorrhinum sp. PSN259]|nr:hypothetical protein QBC43DRAFT_116961 [Cladorrhinum sp. PSN259]